jgi:hypothetical protein
MSAARPTSDEERWRVLAERYPSLRSLVQRRPEAGRWRYATLPSRVLFFVLGLFAAGLSYGLIDLVGIPAAGFVTGLVLVGIAEGLIRRRQLFASGIEEALWSAGAAMMAFELFEQWRPGSDAAGLLLMASVLALAGWRLLNPLLTTVAAVLASGSLALAITRGSMFEHVEGAGQACFAAAFFALAAGARRFERPSHDRMIDWLVVAMPVVGFAWLTVNRTGPLTLQTLRDASLPALLPLLLVTTFGLAALATGLRRRTHAPLLAALAAVPLLASELRAVTGLALEWRLILWGGLGLGVAIGLERALRSARDGLTSRDVGEPDVALELVQLGSVAVATPSSGTGGAGPPSPAVEGQGGRFAGGGASGRY